MSASVAKHADFALCAALFLLATMAIGLLLRWQMAGLGEFAGSPHLRRTHSHIGFYGFLFPALWLSMADSGA